MCHVYCRGNSCFLIRKTSGSGFFINLYGPDDQSRILSALSFLWRRRKQPSWVPCLLLQTQNFIDGHFQVYLVEMGRNLFQSFSVFMDEEEVILPFSPAILSYLLPAALKSIRLISGIPLLTANSLLGRPRRDTGLVSLYIYSSLTYNPEAY